MKMTRYSYDSEDGDADDDEHDDEHNLINDDET